jgi:hypothetical protein
MGTKTLVLFGTSTDIDKTIQTNKQRNRRTRIEPIALVCESPHLSGFLERSSLIINDETHPQAKLHKRFYFGIGNNNKK